METSELKKKLESTIEYLETELAQIRTGRVTPNLLDSVSVDAYGSKMTIREVGTINVLDSQTLQVSPWDRGLLDAIAKAIRNSELQLNPAVRNDVVLIPVPALTEERRIEFTKLVSTKLEDAKSSIRNVRQDAMKAIDQSFNNKEFGEDEKFRFKDKVEEIVKEYTEKAEKLAEEKKTDLMTIGK